MMFSLSKKLLFVALVATTMTQNPAYGMKKGHRSHAALSVNVQGNRNTTIVAPTRLPSPIPQPTEISDHLKTQIQRLRNQISNTLKTNPRLAKEKNRDFMEIVTALASYEEQLKKPEMTATVDLQIKLQTHRLQQLITAAPHRMTRIFNATIEGLSKAGGHIYFTSSLLSNYLWKTNGTVDFSAQANNATQVAQGFFRNLLSHASAHPYLAAFIGLGVINTGYQIYKAYRRPVE